ncbi:hypothetical protein F2Q70_00024543 [Brassica cretica]|uniref:Uncharacterized protein n=1 Tax=Brassica cretica TaxID=69181 RepID=A0A8S9L8T8_BRACR|nr:hypothetical protein F2Q70_00024543 [Brassica cretica]
MEEVEEKATKLADRLGLRKDYATVLLAENSWDGKLVVDTWNLPDNDLITKAGVVTDPLLETKLASL